MTVKAILFGSIGTLAETSDIQRRAYNKALGEEGLDWFWDEETYRELLTMSGGKKRLRLLGAATGQPLDEARVDRIHKRKTAVACEAVRRQATLRPGVAELLSHARSAGLSAGIVTSTERPNIDAILHAGGLSADDFAVIVDRSMVSAGKPSPEGYELALDELGLAPHEALAIEDTAISLAASQRAGFRTIVTPGAYAAGQDFSQADLLLTALGDAMGALDPRLLTMVGRILDAA